MNLPEPPTRELTQEIVRVARELRVDLILLADDDRLLAATPGAARYLDQMSPVGRSNLFRQARTRAREGRATMHHGDGVELYAFTTPLGLGLVLGGAAFPRTPSVAGLRALYGLTQAEARVAAALATHLSPKEIALAFGIELSTVRTHLRVVQSKLRATSQTDLVRRLLCSAATLGGEHRIDPHHP